jgi:hypothetical protein
MHFPIYELNSVRQAMNTLQLHIFAQKKGQPRVAQPFVVMVPGAGIESIASIIE